MKNLKAIRTLVRCARSANRMAHHYACMDMRNKAAEWRAIRDNHIATARQLRADQ